VPWRGGCSGGGTFRCWQKHSLGAFVFYIECRVRHLYDSYVRMSLNRVHDLRQLYNNLKLKEQNTYTCVMRGQGYLLELRAR